MPDGSAPAWKFSRPAEAWKGVSLGGWLLLEPGPATPLFETHPDPDTKEEMRCEWMLMKVLHKTLGKKKAAEVIEKHRQEHTTKKDFERIRDCGLNAVRLPFGYWVVTGPTRKDPYVGPGLEYIDRAVAWAEECGLQIVLDLHGCPGGESGEAPCGFRQRAHEGHQWNWRKFRMEESLKVVEVIAKRYRNRKSVTGIAVCNEPCGEIPEKKLLEYYARATDVVRAAGMPASRVAVVLPCFQRQEDAFIQAWRNLPNNFRQNVCFDLHCYHCFENNFNGKSFAEHLRHVEENAEWLRKYPIVVGEWSLALGVATWSTCGWMKEKAVKKLFGTLQNKAYKSASHGSFFWNWAERKDSVEWNYQIAHKQGLLSGHTPALPAWNGKGEDPLEEEVHPSPAEARVLMGEPVHFRVFHGRYIDAEGCSVNARWPDKGPWQQLTFCPTKGAEASSSSSKAAREIVDGQVVRIKTSSGKYLCTGTSEGQVLATVRGADGKKAEWIVHMKVKKTPLRHRSLLCLENRATECMLDADEEAESVQARWNDLGGWQTFVIEKAPHTQKKRAPSILHHTHAATTTNSNLAAKRRRCGEEHSDA
eukprot:TRINITY_DN120938_c0_g1_i1.p1 TRINITY_DN120938_c0_g1~~TRINITY_DN120938_c0_g1_i1.p1  ORF type:complete len:613 (-),score=126.15 TRINITY_DN120938_c0_g1_i1:255-2024(-)